MTIHQLDGTAISCGTDGTHDHACPQAVLSIAFPAVQDIRGPEGLGNLWNVFSKCKGSLQDGQRLENISWRHWYQTCAAASLRAADARKRMSYSLGEDLDRTSSISSVDAASEASTSSGRRSVVTRASTRRSPSPHGPLSHASTSPSSTRSTGQQEWSQSLAPRPEPYPQDQHLGMEAAEPAGSNRMTSTGTTPRPASYPTPTTFRPDFLATRSLSHAAHQRSEGGSRWDQGQSGDDWRTSVMERSFGQVLTDVFRVPSVTDVAGKRSPRSAVHAAQHAESRPSETGPSSAISSAQDHSGSPSQSPHSARLASTSASPHLTRGAMLLSAPGSAGTPDARGPQVNVMEPTPAPSRVGSLGDNRLFGVSITTGPASASGATASPVSPPRSTDEQSAILESLTRDVSRPPDTLTLTPGSHRTASAGRLALNRASPKSRSPARKKEKKGMFFIQSPGHAARDGMRQGSASGSEGSVSIGSNSLSPMVQARQAASPLSAVELPEAAAPGAASPVLSTGPVAAAPAPTAAVAPAITTGRSPALAKSPAGAAAAHKRRTSSASHKPPPMGHRRISGERPQRSAHAAGPTQQAHLAPPKRTASAASMAGKFQGEKARAAEVINARLQRQRQAEKDKQAEARSAMYKRQQSEPDLAHAQTREVYGEPIVADDQADDDEWSSETEDTSPVKEGQNVHPGGKGRSQGNQPGMDLARAADEARRQRELFAKRAIYGSQADLTKAGQRQPMSRPGLLSNLFETQRDVIRRNASMVDLGPPAHVPTHELAKRLNTHHVGSPHAFTINRSKSSVALPVATGVSVSKEGFQGAPDIEANTINRASTNGRSKLRLPPKPEPIASDMSPASSPEDEGPLMGREEAMRRIENLAGRRGGSQLPAQAADQGVVAADGETGHFGSGLGAPPLERSYSNPMPVQHGQSAMIVEPALPQTPTTRRRQMLATELPENLRLNLIWERRSRTPLYPPKKTAALKSSASAHDLPDVNRSAAVAPDERSLRMQRQDTQPVAHVSRAGPSEPAPPTERSQQDASAQAPRRRTANLLSGGAILRPLTRTEHHPQVSPEQDNNPRAGRLTQRSQSTANVVGLGQHTNHTEAPASGPAPWPQDPPGIKRSATESMAMETMREDAWRRARLLKQRQGELSQSFRSHGW